MRIKPIALLAALLALLILSGPLVGQAAPDVQAPSRSPGPGQTQPAADAGACAACGAMALIWILVVVFILVIVIVWRTFLAIWISRDSRARGMDNGVLFVLLAIFLDWIGLVVYLASRPGGNLYVCPHCGKNRLEGSRRCPHCGNP